MLDAQWLIFIGIVIIFLSAFIQGVTSFGFSLVAMPLLSLLLPLQIVVPLIVIFALCTNTMILYQTRQDVRLLQIWPLVITSVLAAPFGAYLLLIIDPGVLKVVIGSLIILFSYLQFIGYTVEVKKERSSFAYVGIMSGLLNGSISLSGPPVALFLANQRVRKETFRANITAHAFILNIATLIAYFAGGLLNREVLEYSLLFLPALFVGVLFGMYMATKIEPTFFRKLTLIIIFVCGIWTSLNGFGIV